MKLVVGFIPFSATPDGLVVERVYEMWKDRDFVLDLGMDPIAAAEEVRRLSPEKVLLVGSSRYAPEGITEKEIVLETRDRWEMLELLRPGLDGRYYLEDVAYGLLIFSVVDRVYALYFRGDYTEENVAKLNAKVEEKVNWLLRS
ncbi:MAG: hypothetical protein L7H21_06460 [Sulfolobales archaeon]|nr:hypothetical protein [Sulfolobales archaeon]MCG2894500.1 hypothetical protein [Sulfolobales archaeon]MCG2911248.1 hypothetical protein [Sulfolobales archaeon]